MYNGSSNNNNSNNEYTTVNTGNYNSGYSENGYSTSNNYLNSNYNGGMNSVGMMIDAQKDAATCRKWMITALVLQIVSLRISLFGIVALIVSIVAMTKVRDLFDRVRLFKDKNRVVLALWIWVGYIVFSTIFGFCLVFYLVRHLNVKGKIDPMIINEKIMEILFGEHTVISMLFTLSNIVIFVYLLYVWIRTFIILKKF